MSTSRKQPNSAAHRKLSLRIRKEVAPALADNATAADVRRVTERIDLIQLLAERLSAYQPRIAVDRDMVEHLMSFFSESKQKIMFDSPPFEGGRLFDMVAWDAQDNPDTLRCGLPLLQLLSAINDTVALEGGMMDMTGGRLIDIIIPFLNSSDTKLLKRSCRGNRVSIKTTKAGVARFGVQVDVRLVSANSAM